MIIVTGEHGQLSLAIKEYLSNSGYKDTINLSVRGKNWSNSDFVNVRTIIHVAGVVPKVGICASDFYKVNRDLTIELATKAKSEGVKQFVYISSMAVYGAIPNLDPLQGTIDNDTPCDPTTDYGKSKLEAENGLRILEDESFKVVIIRVPSIYSEDKREYFTQYELICRKFRCVPQAFRNCYRSAITVTNLCELLRLVVLNNERGTICPDNGAVSTSAYCAMLHPEMRKSRMVGFCVEKFLYWHPMVKSLFGAISYGGSLSNVFDGAYRLSK